MTNFERAKLFYNLIKKECEGCYDSRITLNVNMVGYEDQGGQFIVDFGHKTLSHRVCLKDLCDTKEEFIKDYLLVDESLVSVEFFKTINGIVMINIENKYDTNEELKSALSDISLFMDNDILDKVFEGVEN